MVLGILDFKNMDGDINWISLLMYPWLNLEINSEFIFSEL